MRARHCGDTGTDPAVPRGDGEDLVTRNRFLVFDMDGVLVDVSESYRETIQQTVERFTGKRVSRETIQEWNNRGGWNDDWALSTAMIRDHGVNAQYDEVVKWHLVPFRLVGEKRLRRHGKIWRQPHTALLQVDLGRPVTYNGGTSQTRAQGTRDVRGLYTAPCDFSEHGSEEQRIGIAYQRDRNGRVSAKLLLQVLGRSHAGKPAAEDHDAGFHLSRRRGRFVFWSQPEEGQIIENL